MAGDGRLVRVEVPAPGPGQVVTVDVEGTTVAIASIGGRLRAFDGTCTHRGCSLADGTLSPEVERAPRGFPGPRLSSQLVAPLSPPHPGALLDYPLALSC